MVFFFDTLSKFVGDFLGAALWPQNRSTYRVWRGRQGRRSVYMRGLQGRPYVNSRLARGARQITDRPKATGEGLRLANSLLASVVQDRPKSYWQGLQRRQTAFMRGVQGKPTAYWRGEQGRLTSYWRRVQGRPLAYWREVKDVIPTAYSEGGNTDRLSAIQGCKNPHNS